MRPYYHDEASGITIYHGDCRDILPTLIAGSVDLLLTDPPYGISVCGSVHVGHTGRGSRRFDFFRGDTDWDAMVDLAVLAINASLPLLNDRASIYAWVGHRQFGPLVAHLESLDWQTRFLVWEKKCPVPPPPGAGWPSGAELCVYAYRARREWTHRGKNTPRSNVIVADSFRFGQPGKVDHPTQKPAAVINPIITASSRVNSMILDPFMGSGSVLRAAKDLGRRAIGIEVEERYCEIAARRLRQSILPMGGGV
jgi:site-specific DNA-methyltransferase (adenine-specific)